MVSNYFLEDLNRTNNAKYKIEEKFQLIHYVYSLLFSKIYGKTHNFGIKKNNFDFHFKAWKNKKTTGLVDGPIISNQLPQPMSLAKTPSNY